MLLKDRTAIITGASRGLGQEINRLFIAEGAKTVTCSKNGNAVNLKCDVSNPTSIKYFVHTSVLSLEHIDILVCNAGIYGPIGAVEDNNWDHWQSTLETNLFGVVNMCRAVIPHMKKQGHGKIIILSGGGATKPMPNFSAYAASKAAVVRFAETIAEELREYNIEVNCVAPGSMNTDFMTTAIAAGPEKSGHEFHERMLKQKQDGGDSIETAAELCLYLASNKSNGITGKLISAVWDNWNNLDKTKLQTDMYTLRRIDKESML